MTKDVENNWNDCEKNLELQSARLGVNVALDHRRFCQCEETEEDLKVQPGRAKAKGLLILNSEVEPTPSAVSRWF